MNRRLRLLLLKWHRRVGVAIALLVMFLVVTGIALNHSGDLHLDSKALRNRQLLHLYGVDVPEVTSYLVGGQWLSHLGGNHLYLQEKEVAYCEQPMRGAVQLPKMIAVLCHQQLLLLTPQGEVVERIGSVFGLPEDVDALAAADGELLLRSGGQIVAADLNGLQFLPVDTTATDPDWVQSGQAPDALRQQLLAQYLGDAIHWERVLLDFHSGRILGRWGVWLMDAAALLLFALALSGCWVWLTKPGRFR